MEWLLNFGGLTGLVAAIVAIFTTIGAIIIKSERSGVNRQKAKEAARREEELKRISMAANARPIGGVQHDPNNRDNRRKP